MEKPGNRLSYILEGKSLRPVILKLGFPIMLSNLSQTLMGSVDTIMVGRLSMEALAAAGLGNVFMFTFIFPLTMISVGVRIKASRRFGEGKFSAIGTVLDNSLILAAGIGVIFTTILVAAGPSIMQMINEDPVVGSLAGSYIRIRFLSTPVIMLIVCLQAFFEATGRTHITMYSTVLLNALNAVFNAVLIFGLLGFPALGLMGAAWGSFLATIFGFLFLLFLVIRPREKIAYRVFTSKNVERQEATSLFKLSLPTMLETFANIFSFFIFVWIHNFIGTVALAAAAVLNTIYGLVFLPAVGLGKATGILVSQSLGANRPDRGKEVVHESLKMGFIMSCVIAITGIILAVPILSLYTTDAQVIQMARIPLIILLTGSSLNSMGMVSHQAIIGAGLTRWAFKAQVFICYVLYLPVVYFLGVHLGLGIMGTYMGEASYFIWVFLVFFWKFRKGDWQYEKL